MISNSSASVGRVCERLLDEPARGWPPRCGPGRSTTGRATRRRRHGARSLGRRVARAPSGDRPGSTLRRDRRRERRQAVALVEERRARSASMPDHVHGPLRRGSVDHVGERPEVVVEPRPVVDDEDVRPPALDDLCVPQRRRVAPPADDHRVRRERRQDLVEPVGGAAVSVAIDRRSARRGQRRPAVGASRSTRRRRAAGRSASRRDGGAVDGPLRGRRGADGRATTIGDRPRARIAEPRPGDQDRPEVVALDVGVE